MGVLDVVSFLRCLRGEKVLTVWEHRSISEICSFYAAVKLLLMPSVFAIFLLARCLRASICRCKVWIKPLLATNLLSPQDVLM